MGAGLSLADLRYEPTPGAIPDLESWRMGDLVARHTTRSEILDWLERRREAARSR